MRKSLFFLFALLFFAPSVHAADPEGGLKYKDALKKYHKHGEFFNRKNLHAHIEWDVVYKSMEFRETAARTYAKYYKLTDAELNRMIEEERAKAAQGEEFIVILYTYDKSWNDLEKKDTIWRLQLRTDSHTHDPVSVTKIKPTPIEKFMYPYMRPWTNTYSVTFSPGLIGGDEFHLSLFGVLGHQELSWHLSK